MNDYECYDGVLGYQYEPKKRVRSPLPVPVELEAEGASPNSIASDTDSRTQCCRFTTGRAPILGS